MMNHITLSFKLQALNSLNQFVVNFFQYGHFAVDIFIVISGYCLMLPVLNSNYRLPNGILNFYKRRFIRIYPPCLISGLISILLITFFIGDSSGTIWDLSIPVNKFDIITHIFIIPDLFYVTTYKINYIFWSVAVEGRIYIIFPLILWCCRKWSVSTTFILSFFVSFSIWISLMTLYRYYPQINVSDSGVHPYIILFVAGMFAATLSFKTPSVKLPWVAMFIVFTLLQIILVNFSKGATIKDINMGVCTLCFLVSIQRSRNKALNVKWIEKLLSNRVVVFVGAYAYSIYLFHPFLIQVLLKYIIYPLKLSPLKSFYVMLLAGSSLILLICYGMFLLFEMPFLRYRNIKKGINKNEIIVIEPAP
jgi:peptidoglycan/LPS O-acetylase OafA/YrhL